MFIRNITFSYVNLCLHSCRLRTTAGVKLKHRIYCVRLQVCTNTCAHAHTHKLRRKTYKKQVGQGQVRGFGTQIWHHQRAPLACFTHFALCSRGRGGKRGRGHGFFGLTEEAILVTPDPQRGDVLGFSALPGTQRVPRQRLPVWYRNERHQPANQREAQLCPT